jgi:hypothetical protein
MQRLLCALVLALSSVSVGCFGTTIALRDHDAFIPAARASYEILPGQAERRDGALLDLVMPGAAASPEESAADEPPDVVVAIAIDAELARASGRDHQRIKSNEVIVRGGVVEGPARLDLDADIITGRLAGRAGLRIFDWLSLEGLLGFELHDVFLDLSATDVDADRRWTRPSALFGAQVGLRPHPAVDLIGQVAFGAGESILVDSRAEVALNLTRHIALTAGYRWLDYTDVRYEESDIDIEIEGPTAGVALSW